ncbi:MULTISPECIES: nitroreductase/quinone reductase family protein [unclassified Nocardia]|uniref:nitroreductase/quinone reductase family protein n=1 Tax=unclassified Nocardia TaxID=2637762 RepID=UPI001CE406DC|nr:MULTISPECIES: nitroreductase/quinone reductase family protein [unclassified Nocardia]
MSIRKTPAGTRGTRPFSSNGFVRVLMGVMRRYHRLRGDRYLGMDLLYLTTVGAKSGRQHTVVLSRFADGDGWLVVASMAGSIQHPGWYHNIAAHPDQVWIEVGGKKFRVVAQQLTGEQREAAWKRITTEHHRYIEYQEKTDRVIPILKLTPAT